jgi:DNA-binding NarL/FixJ family response regulator
VKQTAAARRPRWRVVFGPIVIMDITESCSDVIRAIGLLSLLSVEQPTGIVALVGTDNDDVLEAVQAGARGFLLNSCRAEELVTATRAVVAGEGFITPRIAGWLLSHVASQLPSRRGKAPVPVRGITRRELEILRLIAPGRVSRMVLVGQPCAMGERSSWSREGRLGACTQGRGTVWLGS